MANDILRQIVNFSPEDVAAQRVAKDALARQQIQDEFEQQRLDTVAGAQRTANPLRRGFNMAMTGDTRGQVIKQMLQARAAGNTGEEQRLATMLQGVDAEQANVSTGAVSGVKEALDKSRVGELALQILGGAPVSLAPQVMAAAALTPAGRLPAMLAGAAAGNAQLQGEGIQAMYDDPTGRQAALADPQRALDINREQSLKGSLVDIGPGIIAHGAMTKAAKSLVKGVPDSVVGATLRGGVTEAAPEVLQGELTNAGVEELTGETRQRDIWDRADEAAGGMIQGGGLAGAGALAANRLTIPAAAVSTASKAVENLPMTAPNPGDLAGMVRNKATGLYNTAREKASQVLEPTLQNRNVQNLRSIISDMARMGKEDIAAGKKTIATKLSVDDADIIGDTLQRWAEQAKTGTSLLPTATNDLNKVDEYAADYVAQYGQNNPVLQNMNEKQRRALGHRLYKADVIKAFALSRGDEDTAEFMQAVLDDGSQILDNNIAVILDRHILRYAGQTIEAEVLDSTQALSNLLKDVASTGAAKVVEAGLTGATKVAEAGAKKNSQAPQQDLNFLRTVVQTFKPQFTNNPETVKLIRENLPAIVSIAQSPAELTTDTLPKMMLLKRLRAMAANPEEFDKVMVATAGEGTLAGMAGKFTTATEALRTAQQTGVPSDIELQGFAGAPANVLKAAASLIDTHMAATNEDTKTAAQGELRDLLMQVEKTTDRAQNEAYYKRAGELIKSFYQGVGEPAQSEEDKRLQPVSMEGMSSDAVRLKPAGIRRMPDRYLYEVGGDMSQAKRALEETPGARVVSGKDFFEKILTPSGETLNSMFGKMISEEKGRYERARQDWQKAKRAYEAGDESKQTAMQYAQRAGEIAKARIQAFTKAAETGPEAMDQFVAVVSGLQDVIGKHEGDTVDNDKLQQYKETKFPGTTRLMVEFTDGSQHILHADAMVRNKKTATDDTTPGALRPAVRFMSALSDIMARPDIKEVSFVTKDDAGKDVFKPLNDMPDDAKLTRHSTWGEAKRTLSTTAAKKLNITRVVGDAKMGPEQVKELRRAMKDITSTFAEAEKRVVSFINNHVARKGAVYKTDAYDAASKKLRNTYMGRIGKFGTAQALYDRYKEARNVPGTTREMAYLDVLAKDNGEILGADDKQRAFINLIAVNERFTEIFKARKSGENETAIQTRISAEKEKLIAAFDAANPPEGGRKKKDRAHSFGPTGLRKKAPAISAGKAEITQYDAIQSLMLDAEKEGNSSDVFQLRQAMRNQLFKDFPLPEEEATGKGEVAEVFPTATEDRARAKMQALQDRADFIADYDQELKWEVDRQIADLEQARGERGAREGKRREVMDKNMFGQTKAPLNNTVQPVAGLTRAAKATAWVKNDIMALREDPEALLNKYGLAPTDVKTTATSSGEERLVVSNNPKVHKAVKKAVGVRLAEQDVDVTTKWGAGKAGKLRARLEHLAKTGDANTLQTAYGLTLEDVNSVSPRFMKLVRANLKYDTTTGRTQTGSLSEDVGGTPQTVRPYSTKGLGEAIRLPNTPIRSATRDAANGKPPAVRLAERLAVLAETSDPVLGKAYGLKAADVFNETPSFLDVIRREAAKKPRKSMADTRSLSEVLKNNPAAQRLYTRAKSLAAANDSILTRTLGLTPEDVLKETPKFVEVLKNVGLSNSRGVESAPPGKKPLGKTTSTVAKNEQAPKKGTTDEIQDVVIGIDGKVNPPDQAQLAKKEALFQEVYRLVGKQVQVRFDKLHAQLGGSGRYTYTPDSEAGLIEIALNAVNPTAVAHHEALHHLWRTLGADPGTRKLKAKIERVVSRPSTVTAMFNALVAQERKQGVPAAQARENAAAMLADAEERVAYAFQMWNTHPTIRDTFREDVQTVFSRIAKFIRDLLGVFTDVQQVEAVMTAMHNGELSDVATRKTMFKTVAGENFQEMVKNRLGVVAELFDKVYHTGVERLRATEVPALVELADMMYTEVGEQGEHTDFVELRSRMTGKWTNVVDDILDGYTRAEQAEALANLQAMKMPKTKLEHDIRKFLDMFLQYQNDVEGIEIRRAKNYFPRSWNPLAIASNKTQFIQLLQKEGGLNANVAREAADMLTATGGITELAENEHHINYMPFAAASNARQFTFINSTNAHKFAEFQHDDMGYVLENYVREGVHRAEFARLFGDKGEVIEELLKEAVTQGATDDEINQAKTIIQGLEGTLHQNSLSPAMRVASSSAITLQNMALLPLALFSQFMDPLAVGARSGDYKDIFRAYGQFLTDFKNTLSRQGLGEMHETARFLGIIQNDMAVYSMAGLRNGVGQLNRRMNDLYFKFNGMQLFNDSMRVAALGAGERYIIRNKDNAEALRELGISVADVNIKPDGRLDIYGGSERLHNALYRYAESSVIRPSAGQQPTWMQDPRLALLTHMRRFAYGFEKVIMQRAQREMEVNNNPVPSLMVLAGIPVMIAVDVAKWSIFGGGATAGWGVMDYLQHGVNRSGIAGRMGSFIAPLPGEGLMKPEFGPSVDRIMDFANGDFGRAMDRIVPGMKYAT